MLRRESNPLQRYTILLEKRAQRQLDRLDKDTGLRILGTLHILRDDGMSSRLDLKKLKSYRNHYRLRVGRYRVLFELEAEKTAIVYAILPRKRAY